MEKTHDIKDCDCPYNREPKYVSRAYWVCPICGRDVSLEYVVLQDCINKDKKD
jgi:hypothetical protein